MLQDSCFGRIVYGLVVDKRSFGYVVFTLQRACYGSLGRVCRNARVSHLLGFRRSFRSHTTRISIFRLEPPPFILIDMTRTGIGFDAHRLVAGRRLMIGGVEIPHERGLLGHSDADVLAHAVMDALLGAIADGDIGQHFPPSDPCWKDADSIALLRQVTARVHSQGWQVSNVDATVLAESPRLAPHIPRMRERMAEAIGVTPAQVSVKATTPRDSAPSDAEKESAPWPWPR